MYLPLTDAGSEPRSVAGSDAPNVAGSDDTPPSELGSNRVVTSVVIVSDQTAKRWLAFNKKNRPISNTVVNRYVSDMAHGRWQFAGDPIRFDTTGNLLDGQHRLTALSRVPGLQLRFLVIRGLDNNAQTVMDQGRKRSPGQQLALTGLKNSNAVAAAVKILIAWDNGMLFRDQKLKSEITSAVIEKYVEEHQDLISKFNAMHTNIVKTDARPSIAGAAAMKFLQIDDAAAVEFFHLLVTGAGRKGDPIVALDQRLRRLRRDRRVEPDRDVLSFFILSWNAWRDGKSMTKFQRPRSGSWTKNNFPVPH